MSLLVVGLRMCFHHVVTMFDGSRLTERRRGLTVSGRLSEDSSVSVAVIEAGFNAESLPEVSPPIAAVVFSFFFHK